MALKVLMLQKLIEKAIVLDNQRIDHRDGIFIRVTLRIDAIDLIKQLTGDLKIALPLADDFLIIGSVKDRPCQSRHPHDILAVDAVLVYHARFVGLALATVFDSLKQKQRSIRGIAFLIFIRILFRVFAYNIRAIGDADEFSRGKDIHTVFDRIAEKRLSLHFPLG